MDYSERNMTILCTVMETDNHQTFSGYLIIANLASQVFRDVAIAFEQNLSH